MATIPTDEPWVPLRILGLGLDASQRVEADVFLLTDDEPSCSPAVRADPRAQRGASTSLLDDLRSDVGMEWVPDDMWLTYLQLDAAAGDLDYDLAVSADPERRAVDRRRRRRPARMVPVRDPLETGGGRSGHRRRWAWTVLGGWSSSPVTAGGTTETVAP